MTEILNLLGKKMSTLEQNRGRGTMSEKTEMDIDVDMD